MTLGRLLAALIAAALAIATPALAQEQVGSFTAVGISASLTRANNTTAYTANEAVCASTSVACSPLMFQIGRAAGNGTGTITNVRLLKSGSSTTNATFLVYFFGQTPIVTGIHDASAYTGPFAADMPYYLGYATCATANSTSDGTAQVWFDCTMSNPGAGTTIQFKSTNNAVGVPFIYGMIDAGAAYTPVAQELFTLFISGIVD